MLRSVLSKPWVLYAAAGAAFVGLTYYVYSKQRGPAPGGRSRFAAAPTTSDAKVVARTLEAQTAGPAANALATIVITLEDTEASKRALAYALTLFSARSHRIFLLSVVNTHDHAAFMIGDNLRGSGSSREQIIADRSVAATALLTSAIEEFGRFNFNAEGILALGSPAEAIIHEARFRSASLVVMASRDSGGMARAVLGSTSEYIASHSPIPTLFIKAYSLAPSTVAAPRRFLVVGAEAGLGTTLETLARAGDALSFLSIAEDGAQQPQPMPAAITARCEAIGVKREAKTVAARDPVGESAVEAVCAVAAGADVLVVEGSTSSGLFSVGMSSASSHILHRAPVNAVLMMPSRD